MTADQAGDILGTTASTAKGYYREGLVGGKLVKQRTWWGVVWRLDLRGADVQRLHRLRTKYGVREGMRRARVELGGTR